MAAGEVELWCCCWEPQAEQGEVSAAGPGSPRHRGPRLRRRLSPPGPTPCGISCPGMPRFVAVGYVDGEAFASSDSESRRARLIVPWLPQEKQQHPDGETQKARDRYLFICEQLDTVQKRCNTSGGAHTLQMFSCDLLKDISVRGYNEYVCKCRMITAYDTVAEITKRSWKNTTLTEMCKQELRSVCTENLKRNVNLREAVLGRTERPEVRVSGKEADRIQTLSFRAHDSMASSGMKDGAVQYQEYQCRMEHASLGQPGLDSWEPWPKLIPAVAVPAIVVVIAGIVRFVVRKCKSGKRQQGYRAAPGRDGGSGGSTTGSESSV